MVSDKKDDSSQNIFLNTNLKNPVQEDAVVISGMSGIFPNSNNVDEFKDNLYNKKDMISTNYIDKMKNAELSGELGMIPRKQDYDAGNFGEHWKWANYADPCHRLMFETTFEALLDAGLNPADIEHTNVGVYIGMSFSESEAWISNRPEHQFTFISILKATIGPRLAYYLKLKGPVVILDTACSSSLHALELAFKDIMAGVCDKAIVIGANMCLRVGTTLQFQRLGVLSPDGRCKTFDIKGNGYVRAEAVVSVILQKANTAKRAYAEIMNSKANSDGYKEQGINYPSGEDQKQLMQEMYAEINLSPNILSFLEAHGTGTTVGDPEECYAIDDFFCKTRKTPLPIGSVKSSIGHTEPVSGLCSVVKVLLAMECGWVSPNIHYNVPNPNLLGIIEGRMQVVTDLLEIKEENPIMGINSFGFGGSNAHVIIKSITKKGNGQPNDDLSRLVFVSGRSENAVTVLLNDVISRPLDVNYVRLLQSTFSNYIKSHNYRGYNIISKSGEVYREIYEVPILKILPLHFLFGEYNNWETSLTEFSSVPCFQDTLRRLEKCLTCKNLSISSTILNPKKEVRKEFHVLGRIIVQIGISNILKSLKLRVASVQGYSYGELICAYYDNILTLDEVFNCALILNAEFNAISTEQINGHIEHSSNSKQVQQKWSISRNNLVKNLLTVLDTPRSWTNGSLKTKIASAEHFADAILLKTETLDEDLKSNALIFAVGLSNLKEATNGLDLDDIETLSFHNFQTFLECLGSLYFRGHLSAIDQLYPKVEFPVKKGTPVISSKIKWNHSRKWWLFEESTINSKGYCNIFDISPSYNAWEYINGHVIDDRVLFPASGYLQLVWITLGLEGKSHSIIFEDCCFLRATSFTGNASVELCVQLTDSGKFEISESGSVVVTGKVTIKYYEKVQMIPLTKEGNFSKVISQRDVYKELRLRGYNYTGQFRGIQETNIDGSRAVIKFTNNWVTFLDNLFQLKILAQDTRGLYVPTIINSIKINFEEHADISSALSVHEDESIYEAFYYKTIDCIRSGGVEIRGLHATRIQRRKNLGVPVLESYLFIPNNTNLSSQESIRVNTQILLENTLLYKIKCAEIVDAETPDDTLILSDLVVECLEDQPLIQHDVIILTELNLQTNLAVENKSIRDETDCSLIIGSRLFKRPQMLVDATNALKDNGFIISREPLDFNPKTITQNEITVITTHNTGKEVFVLLKKCENKRPLTYIEVSDDPEFSWLPKVQAAMKGSDEVVVYSQSNPISGLLGFTNCLMREPGYQRIRCVLILDEDEKFEPNSQIFGDQIKKNMTVNVYKNGQWGTFRHLLLNQNEGITCEHSIAKELVRGDISSFRWVQGTLNHNIIPEPDKILVDIYYSPINFKDVMSATGKITVDVAHTSNRLLQDQIEGFEYSGIDQNGHRMAGFNVGSFSNMILADKNLAFRIPDSWSLKEASSVTCVYFTVLSAFFDRGNMKRGDSVLIHSGTGGIGQAAIFVCSQYDCNIFTTCGSASKKEFLLKRYPKLKESHIGNSRDTSFEKMIMRETDGKGVDLVLNSLSDEKLIASIRCLARGGRFLEIGKYDLANNSQLNLMLMEKEASFHGIQLDGLLGAHPRDHKQLMDLMQRALKEDLIKPLDVTAFSHNELEQAYRFMASGKHIGKVVVEVRPENAPPTQFQTLPRFFCNPNKSYVILGGLGGFGLELADWFVLRGVRNLVLVSRSGVKTGYQKSRIERYTNDYGLTVKISTANVTTKEGCQQLIDETNDIAPVGGIFNLAVVLKDAILENQTVDTYKISLAPKAYATKYLDEISRKSCPELEYFVIFSSVSCGRGNSGQTNYGMANSVMERICERRRKDNLPGLAIQWGAIGDVGLLADTQEDHRELEVGGTLQQRLSNCIEVLDTLLGQKSSAVVSSMVVAEKKNLGGSENVTGAIANILGLDLKTVQDTQTLAELGMDSMTSIEIKQLFEREYGIFLSAKDIRMLTFSKIKELEVNISNEQGDVVSDDNETDFFTRGLKLIISTSNDDELIVQLESNVSKNADAPVILMIPGIEGYSNILKPLARKLNAHVVASHYDFLNTPKTIEEMAATEINFIERNIDKKDPVYIVAHSYGTCVALEATNRLEQKGYKITLICCDGSPELFQAMFARSFPQDEQEFETECLIICISEFSKKGKEIKEALSQLPTLEHKLVKATEIVTSQTQILSNEQIKKILGGLLCRLKACKNFSPRYSLKSKIILCKASLDSVKNFPKDLKLEETSGVSIESIEIEGDHVSITETDKLAEIINAVIQK